MAMRRPRIKPVANIQLNSKRKAKPANDIKIVKTGESNECGLQEFEKDDNIPSTHAEEDTNLRVKTENSVSKALNGNNLNNEDENPVNIGNTKDIAKNNVKEVLSKKAIEDVTKTLNDTDAFKCPPILGIQRATSNISNGGIDDVFYSDIEENAQQMDLEKSSSNSCVISPSKNLVRQRIRPTPHFGQRRNSFIISSPSHTLTNEDSNVCNNEYLQPSQSKREKHQTTTFSTNNHPSTHQHHHHTPHKYLPIGLTNSSMGRMRTESGCSAFSDTNVSHKSRKIEDHKQNFRKDFEARFHNGVPEKSAIKMSDLIYYNPATNPMEQKPNPGVKVEQSEIPSSDVKPFTEKLEKDTDIKEGDAVPVPQLKLNAKGELILDDKSLVIETTAEQEARKVLANSSLIYLDENTGMNGFYSRQKRTRDWVPSETIKFYRCLQNVGTDFSLMVSLFPNRTRRDLKLKFKKEERKNCNLINKALLYPKQFDIESLKQQLDEEESLRNEQAKKATKEKSKESKKKKVSNTSIANRVLKQGDVYQNENEQQSKRFRKINIKKDKASDIVENKEETVSIGNDSIEKSKIQGVNEKESDEKFKRKKVKQGSEYANKNADMDTKADNIDNKRLRKHTSNKVKSEEIVIIKEEIIKSENKPESQQLLSQIEYQVTKQLQTEIDELLDSDAIDIQNNNASYESSTLNVLPAISRNERNTSPQNYVNTDTDINKYEQKTFVNLDDGSVNVYSSINDDVSYIMAGENNSLESATTSEVDANKDNCSSMTSERELNEKDIQSILTELAEGSLVLVSTLDPDDPDKVLNEIYMVDKSTGDLCEEPLPIPDNIVQCILTVVS